MTESDGLSLIHSCVCLLSVFLLVICDIYPYYVIYFISLAPGAGSVGDPPSANYGGGPGDTIGFSVRYQGELLGI